MTPSLTYLAVRSDKHGTITIGSTLPRDELDRRMLTPGEVLVQAFQQFAGKSGIHTCPGAQHVPALQLVHDLVSPDGWGHAVPADLRREAVRVLEESRGVEQGEPATRGKSSGRSLFDSFMAEAEAAGVKKWPADDRAAAALSEAAYRIQFIRQQRTARRIYVAGPMTGLPEFNFPAFFAAAAELRGLGWHVENPAEHALQLGAEWQDYLRYDLGRLAPCAAIYLLPGWSRSKAATLWFGIAQALEMDVQLAPGAETPAAVAPQGGVAWPVMPPTTEAAYAVESVPDEMAVGTILSAARDYRDASQIGSMNERRSAYANLESIVRTALAAAPASAAQGDAEQRAMDACHAAIYRWIIQNIGAAAGIIDAWREDAEADKDELHDALAARAAREGGAA